MDKKLIYFLPEEKTVEIDGHSSVLELALKHDIPLDHACGGNGTCTTCRVIVEASEYPLPLRNKIEIEIIKGRGFDDNERLACQLIAKGYMKLRIP